MPIHSDKVIDCIGLYCPMPVMKAREAIREMAPGQVLVVLSDDPAAQSDMKSWSHRTGHSLLEITHNGAVFRFVVRKAR